MRHGFSLAELLVALVIIQIGVLGSLSLLVVAQRTLQEAARYDRAVMIAGAVADSLAGARSATSGERPGGLVLWTVEEGRYVVSVRSGAEVHVQVEGVVGGWGREP